MWAENAGGEASKAGSTTTGFDAAKYSTDKPRDPTGASEKHEEEDWTESAAAAPPSSSSWSLPAAWGENDAEAAPPKQAHRKPPALTISALSLPQYRKPATSPTKPSQHDASSTDDASASSSSGYDGGVAAALPAADRLLPPKASPGALLRLQSSTTQPQPFPLADLMRLTLPQHVIPMEHVIHSMASLSRAGRQHHTRKTNQDSCFAFRQFVQPHQAITGVLDGHGPHGHVVSAFLKQQLPAVIANQLRKRGEVAVPAALTAAFLESQAALKAAAATVNARLSGSTAVVTLIQGRRLTTAWVGDSRAVLVRRDVGGGCLGIALTHDHKPTSARELARILAAGGRVERLSDASGREVGPHRVWLPGAWVPGLAMSRALGDFVAQGVGVSAKPEAASVELQAGDEFLVVASDGVWEFMSIQEAAEVVGACSTAEEACRALVDAATEAWAAHEEGIVDDISVVAARLLPGGAPA